MKVPTDNIYQLIQAMTASEKRYFKRHYASEKSLATDLFDYLNHLDYYNEETVKKHFQNTKVKTNLKVYKVQLTDLILKSLVSYHNKRSIRSKIRMGLEEVEILMDKQLYALAASKLKKIKKLCLEHEELDYIFSIMHFDILLHSFFQVDLKPSAYPMLEELNSYANTLKSIYTLKKINFSLNNIVNNELIQSISPEQEQFYRSFYEKASKKQATDQFNLSEQYYLNSVLSMIQKLVLLDEEKEYHYKKENILLFDEVPERIINYKNFYFAAYYNYLSCCRRLGKFKELEAGISRLKKLISEFPFLEKNLTFVYYLETKYYFQKREHQYIQQQLESKVFDHISRFQQKGEHLTALCYLYFILNNLILGEHPKIQFYFRRLHTLGKSLDAPYRFFFVLLELLCHFESNNSLALQNLLKATQRKIKKQTPKSAFFLAFVQFLRSYSSTDSEQRKELLQQLNEQKAKFTNDGVFKLAQEFILDDWIKAQMQGQGYSKVFSITK